MVAVAVAHPISSTEDLFIGIDVGKSKHIAALAIGTVVRRYPSFSFSNDKEGFELFLRKTKSYKSNCCINVLLEKTGHYSSALIEYLRHQGCTVYIIHAHKRLSRDKTDELDARGLASVLYNQVGLGAQVADKKDMVRRLIPPVPTAAELAGLARHRYELTREMTRRENKIVAIVDEIFPEMTQAIKDPCCETGLNILERLFTPATIGEADFTELTACRTWNRPSNAKLMQLQQLARESIGVTDATRITVLHFELVRLIEQLRMLQRHAKEIDARIAEIVAPSREGRILMSLGIIGPTQAAMIIAVIGDIDRFEKPGELRALFGWCPVRSQTGTSRDTTKLSKEGNRMARHAMYFVGMNAVRQDSEWRETYRELLRKHCVWDIRKKAYRGRRKVLARVIGRIVTVIFFLLKADRELLSRIKPGEEQPPPVLYSRELHHQHRNRHRRQ